MSKKPAQPPGASPYIQGCFAPTWQTERKPPDWHHGHKSEAWRAEWFRGFDERIEEDRKKVKINTKTLDL